MFFILSGLVMAYTANYYLEYIDFTSLSVKTMDSLDLGKVKIKTGFFTINRQNDIELFDNRNKTILIFNGQETGALKTNYGENDFLITYNDQIIINSDISFSIGMIRMIIVLLYSKKPIIFM